MVYGIVLGWPENDIVTMSSPIAAPSKTQISLLGSDSDPLSFEVESRQLRVQLPLMSKVVAGCPQKGGCDWGYVLKMEGLLNAEEKKAMDAKWVKISLQ